jgi:hypothetical protein
VGELDVIVAGSEEEGAPRHGERSANAVGFGRGLVPVLVAGVRVLGGLVISLASVLVLVVMPVVVLIVALPEVVVLAMFVVVPAMFVVVDMFVVVVAMLVHVRVLVWVRT